MTDLQRGKGEAGSRDASGSGETPAVGALAESRAELGDFIAGLSHQLKTPLTAIIGLTETLCRKEMDASTQRRFLEKIGDQARRLSSVLDNLLTLSALQSAGSVALEPLDLRVPLAAAAQDHAPLAEEKGLELAVDLPDEPVAVRGDYGALRTMVGNILDNAVKYTRYGGSIRLSLLCEGQRALISVGDTGVGIEAEDRERVFDQFFRGRTARAEERQGTGLGLAITRQIALAHNGRVSLSSVPQEGTTFTMDLPLVEAQ